VNSKDWFDWAEEHLSQWKSRDAAANAAIEAFANQFTPRARRVLDLAFREAERLSHNFIGTEHVLVGLVGAGEGLAGRVLMDSGLDLEIIRKEVERRVGIRPARVKFDRLPFTPRMKKVLRAAKAQAKALNHPLVGTGHLLLALLSESEGVAAQVFKHFNLDAVRMRETILHVTGQNCSPGGLDA
jgi:ATP-dependent Clp protease ATP-binding subunit ClpC